MGQGSSREVGGFDLEIGTAVTFIKDKRRTFCDGAKEGRRPREQTSRKVLEGSHWGQLAAVLTE